MQESTQILENILIFKVRITAIYLSLIHICVRVSIKKSVKGQKEIIWTKENKTGLGGTNQFLRKDLNLQPNDLTEALCSKKQTKRSSFP